MVEAWARSPLTGVNIMRLQFTDPTGPGTPAWNACDRALEARLEYLDTGSPKTLKRYYNQRQYCFQLLKRHGADPTNWITFFRARLGELEA